MNNDKRIEPHENFLLRDLLALKTVCLAKSSVMATLVKDPVLKGIIERDFQVTEEQIKELQHLLQTSLLAPSDISKECTSTETAPRH
ncbi:hypothetical protein [Alkaliphilus transvaalensis]|uniref:hypothetical protein n=1 Tax=Alkaliphilus transvaalensis TaxID=114628 RepID=UPI00068905F3|nr:hypothetical protein [Alkaliphilus transvaalensis]